MFVQVKNSSTNKQPFQQGQNPAEWSRTQTHTQRQRHSQTHTDTQTLTWIESGCNNDRCNDDPESGHPCGIDKIRSSSNRYQKGTSCKLNQHKYTTLAHNTHVLRPGCCVPSLSASLCQGINVWRSCVDVSKVPNCQGKQGSNAIGG